MKGWHLGLHRKEPNLIGQDILFLYVSGKKQPTRSGRSDAFLSGQVDACVIMGIWHVTKRQNAKVTQDVLPGSVIKPAPSVKLSPSTTPSPP